MRSRSVAGRVYLDVLEHLEETGASACGPNVTVTGSPFDDGLSEAVQVDVQTERVVSSVAVVHTGSPAGSRTVAAALEHDVSLSSSSSPAAERRPEVGEDDPSHLTPVEMHYRWHRCAVLNISLDKVLGFGSLILERLEIRRLQKMLRAGDELAHKRLKAHLGCSAVWLAPPNLLKETLFVFKGCEVVHLDRATYLLSSSNSVVSDFAFPWTSLPRPVPSSGRVRRAPRAPGKQSTSALRASLHEH